MGAVQSMTTKAERIAPGADRLHTREPLITLLKLREFRLPGESERAAKQRVRWQAYGD